MSEYTVKPFSQIICLEALQSNILYPSNCKKTYVIDEKGSVMQSMKELLTPPAEDEITTHKKTWEDKDISILPFEEKTHVTHILLKPVRIVARLVYFLGVSLTVAPAGVLFHSSYSAVIGARILINKLRHKDVDDEDIQRIKKHASCAFRDLKFFAIGSIPVIFTASVLQGQFGTLGRALAAMSFVGILKVAINPENLANVFATKDEREEMKQAIRAKNDFGMVNKHKEILKFASVEIPIHENPVAIYQMVSAAETTLVFLQADDLVKRYNALFHTSHCFITEKSKNSFPTYQEVIGVLNEMNHEMDKKLKHPKTLDIIKETLQPFKDEITPFIEKTNEEGIDETKNLYHLNHCYKAAVSMGGFFKKNSFFPEGYTWKQLQSMSLSQAETLLADNFHTKLGR